MAYILKEILSNKANYGGTRNTKDIKYIVIHFTANDGDKDESNGNYFKNNVVKASAHYFVDDDSITKSVPDNYVAYAVGGKKYANTKGAKLYGEATNSNTLSIELCDTVKNGVIYPTQATIDNALAFTKAKMKEYNIPKDRVIRHFDVTGKLCPAYWVDETKWKTEFWNRLDGAAAPSSISTPSDFIFDSAFYNNYHKDLNSAFHGDIQGLQAHFVNHGMREGRQANLIFNPKYYKSHNKDLANAFGDNWNEYFNHFIAYGYKEWRQSSEVFDPKAYRKNNPDLDKAFGDDCSKYIEHFIKYALKNEFRKASNEFDINIYKKHEDLARTFGNDSYKYYEHWYRSGRNENRKWI